MSALWKTYEEVATYLLGEVAHELGLDRVEGKQAISGKRSGTDWEIDAKGVRSGEEGFVIIECRRYTKAKQNQEKIGALAYRILDTSAAGGIVVSPIGLQAGAAKVASSEGIIHVHLDRNSTKQQYFLQFLNKLFVGIHAQVHATASLSAVVLRTCTSCGVRFEVQAKENTCSSCASAA